MLKVSFSTTKEFKTQEDILALLAGLEIKPRKRKNETEEEAQKRQAKEPLFRFIPLDEVEILVVKPSETGRRTSVELKVLQPQSMQYWIPAVRAHESVTCCQSEVI
jgi:hypothetical protein